MKWAKDRLDNMEGRQRVKRLIWRLLTELPSDGGLEPVGTRRGAEPRLLLGALRLPKSAPIFPTVYGTVARKIGSFHIPA